MWSGLLQRKSIGDLCGLYNSNWLVARSVTEFDAEPNHLQRSGAAGAGTAPIRMHKCVCDVDQPECKLETTSTAEREKERHNVSVVHKP